MTKRLYAFVLLGLALWRPATTLATVAKVNDATSSAAASAEPVNPVIEWNRTLLAIVRTPGAQPAAIHSTRNFAILHAAIFDAVNAIDRTYIPYAVKLPHVPRTASIQAAADEAAHDVLASLYPTFSSTLDAELQQDLDMISDGHDKTEGIAVGEAVVGGAPQGHQAAHSGNPTRWSTSGQPAGRWW